MFVVLDNGWSFCKKICWWRNRDSIMEKPVCIVGIWITLIIASFSRKNAMPDSNSS